MNSRVDLGEVWENLQSSVRDCSVRHRISAVCLTMRSFEDLLNHTHTHTRHFSTIAVWSNKSSTHYVCSDQVKEWNLSQVAVIYSRGWVLKLFPGQDPNVTFSLLSWSPGSLKILVFFIVWGDQPMTHFGFRIIDRRYTAILEHYKVRYCMHSRWFLLDNNSTHKPACSNWLQLISLQPNSKLHLDWLLLIKQACLSIFI